MVDLVPVSKAGVGAVGRRARRSFSADRIEYWRSVFLRLRHDESTPMSHSVWLDRPQ